MKYIPSENSLKARERERLDSSELVKYISSNRKHQIETYFNNDPKILEVERKFGKYLLVPLALPVFEVPDREHFMHWWKKYAIRPTKQKGDYVASVTGYSPFESIDLVQKIGDDWNLNLQTDNFKKEFPHLWQQFNEFLPFDKILSLTLWSSFTEFKEHRDPGELIDIPMSVRIMLYDTNPEETLYIYDNPTKPYNCEDIVQVARAPGTNSRAWNNLRVKHGSVYDPRYKKIMAITTGVVNPERYEQLMTTSINTYKDYCVVSKYSLENYVNI